MPSRTGSRFRKSTEHAATATPDCHFLTCIGTAINISFHPRTDAAKHGKSSCGTAKLPYRRPETAPTHQKKLFRTPENAIPHPQTNSTIPPYGLFDDTGEALWIERQTAPHHSAQYITLVINNLAKPKNRGILMPAYTISVRRRVFSYFHAARFNISATTPTFLNTTIGTDSKSRSPE